MCETVTKTSSFRSPPPPSPIVSSEEKALASHDCLVVCFLSHGKEGRLYARDRDFDEMELWREFYGDRCEALIGKPKMFIVQVRRRLFMHFACIAVVTAS